MRTKMIKLSNAFLIEALQGKAASVISNLPGDIKLLEIRYDLFSKQVSAIITSDTFEDIADSYPIPEFKVVYTESSKTKLQPTANSKPDFRPKQETLIQPSQDTFAVEKEFTSDQRRMLSFTVDGEYVIIKPIQHLKTDWAEINDVVRSLGGKWVKGDIVSYWAIPFQQNQRNEF